MSLALDGHRRDFASRRPSREQMQAEKGQYQQDTDAIPAQVFAWRGAVFASVSMRLMRTYIMANGLVWKHGWLYSLFCLARYLIHLSVAESWRGR